MCACVWCVLCVCVKSFKPIIKEDKEKNMKIRVILSKTLSNIEFSEDKNETDRNIEYMYVKDIAREVSRRTS